MTSPQTDYGVLVLMKINNSRSYTVGRIVREVCLKMARVVKIGVVSKTKSPRLHHRVVDKKCYRDRKTIRE